MLLHASRHEDKNPSVPWCRTRLTCLVMLSRFHKSLPTRTNSAHHSKCGQPLQNRNSACRPSTLDCRPSRSRPPSMLIVPAACHRSRQFRGYSSWSFEPTRTDPRSRAERPEILSRRIAGAVYGELILSLRGSNDRECTVRLLWLSRRCQIPKRWRSAPGIVCIELLHSFALSSSVMDKVCTPGRDAGRHRRLILWYRFRGGAFGLRSMCSPYQPAIDVEMGARLFRHCSLCHLVFQARGLAILSRSGN